MRCFFLLLLPFLSWSARSALALPPTPPSHLVASAPSPTSLRLDWQDNSSNESGFEIAYRAGTSGAFISLGNTNPNLTTLTLTGASGLTTYQFQIRAFLNPGPEYSAYAGPATVTTPAGITSASFRNGYLTLPFSFNLTSTNPAQVTSYAITALPPGLTLNPASGAITGTPTASGGVTGQVTITHTGGAVATSPLAILIYLNPPPLLPPAAGPALPHLTLTTVSPPTGVSLAGLFTDPDVTTAARLMTDLGNLDFAFYPDSAPRTVANFLGYLNRGDFLNTFFHRSVPGFIIQAGAFRADATASAVATQPPVVNEPAITNRRGTVAMAKVGGNPDSATNQFFINLANNAGNLDNQNEGFTVFARIAGNGMTIADAIAALPRLSYTAVNGALTDTPIRGVPPSSYDPATLVRILGASSIPALSLSAVSSQPAIATASITGTTLTLTPLTPGTATITLTATDLDGQTATSPLPITVLQDAYGAWAGQQGFSGPPEALPGADPDEDGPVNLTEFALFSSPLAPNPPAPVPGIDNHHLTLTFPLNDALSGTTVSLQSAESTDGPWTTRWTHTDGPAHPWILSSTPLPGHFLITARDPDPITFTRRYLRLKITRP